MASSKVRNTRAEKSAAGFFMSEPLNARRACAAACSVNGAGELDQHAIACGPNHSSSMRRDHEFN
jgi:hypothetical protein